MLSNSEGHGGPVAARQKPPAPPVSWLLQQGYEREDNYGESKNKYGQKLAITSYGTREEKDDGWKALGKILIG